MQWPLITLPQSSKAFEFQKVTGVGFQNLMWGSTSLSDGSSSPPSSPSLTVTCLRCHRRADSVPIPVELAGARAAAASSLGRFSRKPTPDLPALEGPGSRQGARPDLSRARPSVCSAGSPPRALRHLSSRPGISGRPHLLDCQSPSVGSSVQIRRSICAAQMFS